LANHTHFDHFPEPAVEASRIARANRSVESPSSR
jgi:hypothetical protein